MGNNVSGVTQVAGALDSYVSELGADVIFEKRYETSVCSPCRQWNATSGGASDCPSLLPSGTLPLKPLPVLQYLLATLTNLGLL